MDPRGIYRVQFFPVEVSSIDASIRHGYIFQQSVQANLVVLDLQPFLDRHGLDLLDLDLYFVLLLSGNCLKNRKNSISPYELSRFLLTPSQCSKSHFDISNFDFLSLSSY
jgi:hypothetical protein